jgi:hypothetical protein
MIYHQMFAITLPVRENAPSFNHHNSCIEAQLGDVQRLLIGSAKGGTMGWATQWWGWRSAAFLGSKQEKWWIF